MTQLIDATFFQHPIPLANVRHLYLIVDVQQQDLLDNATDEIEHFVGTCGRLIKLTLDVSSTAWNLQTLAFNEVIGIGQNINETRLRCLKPLG